MTMTTRTYTARFVTPAFLGNAEQWGQWRTPPFKALLRQWWRVAVAQKLNYNVAKIRYEEGRLFGTAAGSEDSRKSRVRVRLSHWNPGKLNQVPDIGKVAAGKDQVSAVLYSGYGPVAFGPKLKAGPAINAGEEARLQLAYPEDTHVEQALALLSAYGTLGGRSRNGWGSLELSGVAMECHPPLVDWRDAMENDWPHGLGKDKTGALIWQSAPQADWKSAMRLLSQTRADLRRAVPDRLILAYPSTKASMPGWDNDARVPHSLRFKVRPSGTQFVAMIFHVPCRPSDALWAQLSPRKRQEFVPGFAAAHAFLDQRDELQRAEA